MAGNIDIAQICWSCDSVNMADVCKASSSNPAQYVKITYADFSQLHEPWISSCESLWHSGKLHHDNWLDGQMAQQKHSQNSQNYYPELDQL